MRIPGDESQQVGLAGGIISSTGRHRIRKKEEAVVIRWRTAAGAWSRPVEELAVAGRALQ